MPDTTIESFVDDIAKRSNIDPVAAETAVGTILSRYSVRKEILQSVQQLFDHLPGAAALAQKYPVALRIWRWYRWGLERLSKQGQSGQTQAPWSPRLPKLSKLVLASKQVKKYRWRPPASYIEDVNPALAKRGVFDKIPSPRLSTSNLDLRPRSALRGCRHGFVVLWCEVQRARLKTLRRLTEGDLCCRRF